MKALEICISQEDDEIIKLGEDALALEKYEKEFINQFETSALGRVLLQTGYKIVYTSFDSRAIQLFYGK